MAQRHDTANIFFFLCSIDSPGASHANDTLHPPSPSASRWQIKSACRRASSTRLLGGYKDDDEHVECEQQGEPSTAEQSKHGTRQASFCGPCE